MAGIETSSPLNGTRLSLWRPFVAMIGQRQGHACVAGGIIDSLGLRSGS
jgi:hypothetical protein